MKGDILKFVTWDNLMATLKKKKRTRYKKINSDGLEMLDVENELRENSF